MKVEDAKWEPPYNYEHHGRTGSKSTQAAHHLKVGDVKRIFHDDLCCTVKTCSLSQVFIRLRRKGKTFLYYHEAPHVLVVKRLEDKEP